MCGRYASARKRIELLEEFRVERDRVSEPPEPDYNVAPTKRVYAVMTRDQRPSETAAEPSRDARDGADGRAAADGPSGVARELRVVRWGLVPFWAKDPKIGSRMINARAETVSSKPAFRHAFKRRRCLLPADGYYEWQRPDGSEADTPGGKGGAKQPYYICRGDGGPLAFAGLYELWRDSALPEDHERAWLWTSTIITTSAPDELGKIHDRMPMVIDPARWADWLDPAADDPADLVSLLAPAAASGLISYPVSTTVNSVRNNGPELITRVEPVRAEPGPGSAVPRARSGRSSGAAPKGTSGSVADKLL
ncbi:MAG TPA: SOS response-associated peptidase [Streptosporangiaceae bacterium]|nr:SOS response-associated peptidase [Streptosporangiaceae bacterium]